MLIIETGKGVTDADTFIDALEFDALMVARFGGPMQTNGRADGRVDGRDDALRRTWAYMASLPWKAKAWPTFGGEIPASIKEVQALLTRDEIRAPGSLASADPENPTAAMEISAPMLQPWLKGEKASA